jgi:hypothetical protein
MIFRFGLRTGYTSYAPFAPMASRLLHTASDPALGLRE